MHDRRDRPENAAVISLVIAVVVSACGSTYARSSEILNPTKRSYEDELVRLKQPAPGRAGTFRVERDGVEVPYQVEETEGTAWIWVCSDFEPGETHAYEIVRGEPQSFTDRVCVRKAGPAFVLDNGRIAVKLPADASRGLPGPVSAVRLREGEWVGGSFWRTARRLRAFKASVLANGPLFAKVRLRYDFEGMAGLCDSTPAFAEVEVVLGPEWRHVEIRERHEMSPDEYWEFEASKGWSPETGVSRPFSRGAGSGLVGGEVEPERALLPGGLPYAREDLFINLFPRWNQHYKDGWYFAATDGEAHVGATVVSAGQWVWPHNNSIRVIVKPSGRYAGLRCPTWKGRRTWWLSAPTDDAGRIDYVARHAWEGLDKLNHEFILDWPGKTGSFPSMNFYNGGQMNPSGVIRGVGRRAMRNAGKEGDLSTLLGAQIMLHPDAYGTYWHYWSPENPNFYTDFIRVPIALVTRLKAHPQFERLRQRAELKLREDMYHAVTLPGGAGQECPGYTRYALRQWTELATLCREHLGFDPATWPRYRAAEYFQKRSSQPDGSVRRMLPMGDTHPARDGSGPKLVEVAAEEVREYRTEELPGFGVIFSNNAGTSKETYLAFKSGPNRGHYHGDQLAFHHCADAKPLVVDHHCGYKPRAGQEHMHNRVAFHTEEFPYANMDGYERLIAFQSSPLCDIAVGQVESHRLRRVEKLPPEIWHQEYPQHRFDEPLMYRRTIVFVKGPPQDYFVIRDQFWAPEPLFASYCLHVLADDMRHEGQTVDFGRMSLFCAEPTSYEFGSLPWSHTNGGLEATQGARLTVHADRGQFITVLYPGRLPSAGAIDKGVRISEDEIRFTGDTPFPHREASCVVVKRSGRTIGMLRGSDIDPNRSQGDVGLFVPDAGYPFGRIPDWLIRQRCEVPDWAPDWATELRRSEQAQREP